MKNSWDYYRADWLSAIDQFYVTFFSKLMASWWIKIIFAIMCLIDVAYCDANVIAYTVHIAISHDADG